MLINSADGLKAVNGVSENKPGTIPRHEKGMTPDRFFKKFWESCYRAKNFWEILLQTKNLVHATL